MEKVYGGKKTVNTFAASDGGGGGASVLPSVSNMGIGVLHQDLYCQLDSADIMTYTEKILNERAPQRS